MSWIRLLAVASGATIVTWVALIVMHGEQPVERLVAMLVGYVLIVWGYL